ncbi:hypothetical protein [Streptomyces sp. NPDC002265]|uniref:hypothetical protein n=1 Tax=Streptomyces sp. NPDC002265 TaxID=3154415 RepID=UPI00331E7690
MPKWRTHSTRHRPSRLRTHSLVALTVSLALLAGTAGPAAAVAEAVPSARRTAQVTLAESGLVNSALVMQANGDLTFTLDTGTAYDPQAVQRQLDDDGSQSQLSDTIRQVIDQDLGDINDDTTWVEFDGVVNTVGTTGLSLTVPAADVQTAETRSSPSSR